MIDNAIRRVDIFLADALGSCLLYTSTLAATVIVGKSGKQIPVMECGAGYETFLDGLDEGSIQQKIEEDYQAILLKADRMKAIRQDPYFNALQVKFAYAVTCHKAQGGQWSHVYVCLLYTSRCV